MSSQHPRPTNWLSFIEDSRPLSQLTIPGTHDSATYNVSKITGFGYVKCQSLNFMQQLNTGCRFLDVRCREVEDKLVCHHSSYFLHLNFQDVLTYSKKFLKTNPSETVVMCVKEEYTRDECTISFEQAFRRYYVQDPSSWYIENKIPLLGEVRGKIVLVRRFATDSWNPLGIDASFRDNTTFRFTFRSYPSQTLVCEDRYNPNNLDEKKSAILENIVAAEANTDPNNLFWSFVSGYMTLWYTPKGMANALNPWLLEKTRCNNKNKGILLMDFINENLAWNLVCSNFPPTDGYTVVESNGCVHAFGKNGYHGQGVGEGTTAQRIATTKSGKGYWILASKGDVYSYGDAFHYGHGIGEEGEAIGFAATPTGCGYWILSTNGGVYTYGDAEYYGHRKEDVVAISPTKSGCGYWILSRYGSVHVFGDAEFHGGEIGQDECAIDLKATPSGDGYWILSRNGHVYSYGDAEHYGDGIGEDEREAVSMKSNANGNGYWLFCSDGSVFNYGSTFFYGQVTNVDVFCDGTHVNGVADSGCNE